MSNEDMNMQFMQIAMKHLPEAKSYLDAKGIELTFEDMQPMMELFLKVMSEAYELGKKSN